MTREKEECIFRLSILILTFLSYTAYHASRKPISIVKNSKKFLDCSHDKKFCHSWISEIDGKHEDEAKTMLGLLDTSFLVSYAIFMFASGMLAERVDLRMFLSMGMLMSGVMTMLFGAAFFWGVHTIWYLVLVQILAGMVQTTGWPGVVTVMANWFGKGRRGLIMGIWNSHTSIGNILGALIAGAYVTDNWGLSFAMPGLLMCSIGFLIYLFLIPEPSIIGMHPPKQRSSLDTPNSSSDSEKSLRKSQSSQRLIDSAYESETEGGIVFHVKQSNTTAISFWGALKIPGVIEFSLCLFFAKLVSYTFLFWLPNYISSTSGLDARSSATLSTFFDVGGIVGGIIAGMVSDHSGMSASTCAVMLVLAIPVMFLYQVLVSSWCPLVTMAGVAVMDICYYQNVFILMLTGLLVNGPYALITTSVSAELGTHPSLVNSSKALATVTAIIDGTGSIGAAVGPFLAGWLAGDNDWNKVFSMLMLADVLALLLLLRMVRQEVRKALKRRISDCARI